MGKRRAQDACPQVSSPCAEERGNIRTNLPTPLNLPGESWATATETEEARQLQYDGKEDAVGLSNRG